MNLKMEPIKLTRVTFLNPQRANEQMDDKSLHFILMFSLDF